MDNDSASLKSMTTNPTKESRLSQRYQSWQALQSERDFWNNHTLLEAFNNSPQRAQQFSLETEHFYFDFSKNHLREETLYALNALADEAELSKHISAFFNGEKVNHTEDRKALHMALRSPSNDTEEEKAVHDVLWQMGKFIDQVHSDTWVGFKDQPITDVVNIGIGGSDLGARMVVNALEPFQLPHTKVHFVTNVDGADISSCLTDLNPATTLFIVASKTFTTLETLTNANTAKQWLLDSGCSEDFIDHHFVAITTNLEKAAEFGIPEKNIFTMWDWVGGRYSLWSAIGLPIALAVGMKQFKQLLAGANQMDEHFKTAPIRENLPALLGLITFWYTQFWQSTSQAILPYNNVLSHFPAFLQQLDMESLGKQVDREGEKVDYPTGIVVWGTEGTNGQHSFHQLLHQGTQIIPADFIVCRRAQTKLPEHQRELFACCLSQSQALMAGKSLAQAKQEILASGKDEGYANWLAPHKVIPGNRPSNTLMLDELTPESLGALIAAYEHKVFTLSVLLNVNPFDQWGVELGKQLGKPISQAIQSILENERSDNFGDLDGSTQLLIDRFTKKA
ncbi:glucose-6-phosphate isomerase [Aurantivibrio plasticivorans]